MKYLTLEEINKNPNTQFGIQPNLQDLLANGNAQFVIELSRDMKIGYTIPSLALHISCIFFQKKCYINFDRFVILAACVLLSSKLKDMDSRLKHLCNSFHHTISLLSGNLQPYNQEKMRRIKDQICIAESEILRTLEYEIDFISPHEYARKYCDIFFGDSRELSKKIFSTTRIIILDSYRTRVCLLYSPLIIFISCFLIASRYEGLRPYETQVIRDLFKEQTSIKGEKLYLAWLNYIAKEEKEIINMTMVRNCLQIINGPLKCWNSSHV